MRDGFVAGGINPVGQATPDPVFIICNYHQLRDSENTNLPSRIPSSGHLWLRLNRKILNVALLRLRFCSIVAAKSNPNPGAIQVY
jgi:hypothetical protein